MEREISQKTFRVIRDLHERNEGAPKPAEKRTDLSEYVDKPLEVSDELKRKIRAMSEDAA